MACWNYHILICLASNRLRSSIICCIKRTCVFVFFLVPVQPIHSNFAVRRPRKHQLTCATEFHKSYVIGSFVIICADLCIDVKYDHSKGRYVLITSNRQGILQKIEIAVHRYYISSRRKRSRYSSSDLSVICWIELMNHRNG